uniref:Ral GTPase-activating protein subunit alpha/beta N-terminal domain-containing protein n=1 Tax=Globodera rostochiensis TaxID=31243 RepID=A0A914IE06_GLORO
MTENDKAADWPAIELCAPKLGILSNFSSSAADTVAHVLIRELVERVDRPSATDVNCFSNDQEVDWVMQVINHALQLPFVPAQSHDTLRAAVRIYLAWTSALTAAPHDCCPKQLLMHPDRYFRKILEALRFVFLDKPAPIHPSDVGLCLSRQGAQIRTVLNTVQHVAETVVDEFRDECWSRSLLFLINATDQLLSVGRASRGCQESIGCLMAGDLCHVLFDCWLQAALNELIPSPSYWRTLTALCRRCLHHVPLVECWARALLQLTVLLLRNLYGHDLSNVHIDETRIFGPTTDDPPTFFPDHLGIVKNVWLNMFNLLGNPANFTREMFAQIEAHLGSKSSELAHFTEQTSLTFFLAVLAYKKMVDMFFDDPSVYIDFSESEDLHSQWLEALVNGEQRHHQQNEWDQQHNLHQPQYGQQQLQHRLSNMSSLSVSHSVPNTPAPSVAAAARKSVAIDFPPPPELVAAALQLQLNSSNNGNRVRAEQHVWYTLRNNEFKQYSYNNSGPSSLSDHRQHHPLSGPLLAVFLQCLGDAALFQLHSVASSLTVVEPQKQHRLSVAAPLSSSTASSSSNTTTTSSSSSNSSCGNYCSDPAMLGAVPHQFRSPSDFPAVEGVAAGRSTALAALCRIVCAKRSRERLDDEQLAQFFTILHEALISRDRLMLCALLFHTADELFKLALNGVQILLPNYVMAIDIVHTESMKLRLHPSASQAEMRAACLRALASVLAWPSVFGNNFILCRKTPPASNKPPGNYAVRNRISRQGSSANLLETEQHYTDLRLRMQRVLVHALRNESVPANVQLALALCALFACESARYDLALLATEDSERRLCQKDERAVAEMPTTVEARECDNGAESAKDDAPPFSISLVRAIVSAVCDNLCKPTWASDTLSCLAAFDSLNCLSSLPHRILFHQGELSIGSLIITSLCRFIDLQLQKPPPHHSRDMHSTVVAAYSCMNVWLNAAPALAEIESCLCTVAQTIELGITGGRDMAPDHYKPASQRVRDAAEMLLHSLFADAHDKRTAIDEFALVQKFGLDLAQFRHFYIGESTILSLYEAQPVVHLSDGLPAVIAVFRTPFYEPWATTLQLLPQAKCRGQKCAGNGTTEYQKQQQQQHQNGFFSPHSNAPSPGCTSLTGQLQTTETELNSGSSGHGTSSVDETATPNGQQQQQQQRRLSTTVKQFEIPREVLLPQCKLDAQFPRLEPVPAPVAEVQSQLAQIRARLAQGSGAPVGDRDTRNVWLNASLGAILTKTPTPESPVAKCNSLRVFLYDMGLVNRRAFGREFTPLDNSSFDIFYDSLSVTVDQHPVRLAETVSVFYVREGQRSAEEILQNNINLRQTNPHYCRLLGQLGKPTARKAPPPTKSMKMPPSPRATKSGAVLVPPPPAQLAPPQQQPHGGYVLDGLEHYIRWKDAQVEIAFITPTGRMLLNVPPPTSSSSSALFVPTPTMATHFPTTTAVMAPQALPSQPEALSDNTAAAQHQNAAGQQKPTGPLSARRTTIATTEQQQQQQQQQQQLTNRQRTNHKNLFYADQSTEFAYRTLQANTVLRELDHGRDQLLLARSIDEIHGMELQFGRQHPGQQLLNYASEHGDSGQHGVGHVAATAAAARAAAHEHHHLVEFEQDVPTCRATILTMPPSSTMSAEAVPPMTLMTATSVIVRSARFTTKWRRHALLARERMAQESLLSSYAAAADGRELLQEEEEEEKLETDGQMGKAAEGAGGGAAEDGQQPREMKASMDGQASSREERCGDTDGSRKSSFVLGSARANRRRRRSSPDASIDSSGSSINQRWVQQQQQLQYVPGLDDGSGTVSPGSGSIVLSARKGGTAAAAAAELDRLDLTGLVCSTGCGAVQRQDSIGFIDAHSPPISPLTLSPADAEGRTARRRSSIFRDMLMVGTGGGGDRRKSTTIFDQSLLIKKQQQQQQNQRGSDGSEEAAVVVGGDGDGTFAQPSLELVPKTPTPMPMQPATSAASMSSYFKSFFRRSSKTPQQQPQNVLPENDEQRTSTTTPTGTGRRPSSRIELASSSSELFGFEQVEQQQQQLLQQQQQLKQLEKLEQFTSTTCNLTSPKSSFSTSSRRESVMTKNVVDPDERRNGSLTLPSFADDSHANANANVQQLSQDRARTKSCVSADDTASTTTSKSEAATVTTTTATMTGAAKAYAKRCADQRILVVWLERTEDMDTFPLDDLIQFTPVGTVPITAMAPTTAASAAELSSLHVQPPPPDHLCFFLSPIERGLCRVQVAGVWTKYGQPGPLLNGTVVSMGALPALLRQTICNVARRKAVELENYQMTHVRRRHAIAEFGRRFPSRLNYTDFVEQLISDG